MNADRLKNFFRGFFFWALSLFLLGMGVKLLMLQRCINPLPYFDQWEGEAVAVYVPYFEHALQFSDLLHPQNEHRIFFTHLYDLLLLLLNGQWDSQLQMVLNAAIHCATIAGFAWGMALVLGRDYWPSIWLGSAVAVVSPFGWENALWGFQSQFYFLLLFSLLAICLLSTRQFSLPWRFGLAAGICALFTMASGLLAFVAAGAVVFLELLKNRPHWRNYLPTLVICVALAGAGLLLVGPKPQYEDLAAHSFKDFCYSLGQNLSWPTGLHPWLAPFNLFPLLLLGWLYLRSSETSSPAERMILGIGAWTILQSIATACARGKGGVPPTWRYMDTLVFLFIANFLSVALLIGKYRQRLRLPFFWYAASGVWLLAGVSSLWTLNERAWDVAVPAWAARQRVRLQTFRAFMATDDPSVFDHHDFRDMPFVYIPELVFLLHNKDVRSILPACGRDPLKITPASTASPAFVSGGAHLDQPDPPTEHCLGSYNTNGPAARGTFESAPLTSSFPYLEFQVAGNLGAPGLSLQLVDLASGKITDVKPAREPEGQWLNVDVKAPSGPFKLVAHDNSSTGWFAFKEPREMARFSFWAQQIVGTGKCFLAAGFLSLAIALGTCFLRRNCENPPLSSPVT